MELIFWKRFVLPHFTIERCSGILVILLWTNLSLYVRDDSLRRVSFTSSLKKVQFCWLSSVFDRNPKMKTKFKSEQLEIGFCNNLGRPTIFQRMSQKIQIYLLSMNGRWCISAWPLKLQKPRFQRWMSIDVASRVMHDGFAFRWELGQECWRSCWGRPEHIWTGNSKVESVHSSNVPLPTESPVGCICGWRTAYPFHTYCLGRTGLQ